MVVKVYDWKTYEEVFLDIVGHSNYTLELAIRNISEYGNEKISRLKEVSKNAEQYLFMIQFGSDKYWIRLGKVIMNDNFPERNTWENIF